MSAAAALVRLEALLDEERTALGRLETARVVVLTAEKETLLATLVEEMPRAGRDERDHFGRLVENMRRNVILYAHARDCIRDAVLVMKTHAIAPKRVHVTG
jgi:flagellar biosynthesis/type III secretory pathway chaperone